MKVPALPPKMSYRYEVRELIAEGGLGSVFKGWDRELGREVAVKRIRTAPGQDFGAAVDRLVREARQQAALRHPNIVAVYDAGVDREGGFIVMELVRGGNLEEAIQRSALTLAEFDSLVRQVLAGLGEAHRQGIIHLDLKPENIMLQPEGDGNFQVKILDFGLAQNYHAAPRHEKPQRKGLFGSVFFMAPEQFEKGPVNVRADLYALGCIFYYALTQKLPFAGDTSPQVIVAHRHHRVAPLAPLRPDLPPGTIQWVESLMSRLPADRPPTLPDALRSYLATVPA